MESGKRIGSCHKWRTKWKENRKQSQMRNEKWKDNRKPSQMGNGKWKENRKVTNGEYSGNNRKVTNGEQKVLETEY